MSLRLLADENVHALLTQSLKRKGVDILSAEELNFLHQPDERVMQISIETGRVVLTHDTDFLLEAARLQRANMSFPGVIFVHQSNLQRPQVLRDAEVVCLCCEPHELANRVEYLPL